MSPSKVSPHARRKHAGFSQIEMGIVLTIIGFSLSIGLPNATVWLQNIRIRNAADAIQNGLQVARWEALRRNRPVEFVLTAATPVPELGPESLAGAEASPAGPNWVVRVYRENGAYVPGDFVQARMMAEGSKGTVVDAQVSSVVFNGIGLNDVANLSSIRVGPPHGGCVVDGGTFRCLNVQVGPGGMVRMCDPAVASATDTRKC